MGISISQLDSNHWSELSLREPVTIHHHARCLKRISHTALWENFLMGTSTTFAVTFHELQSLLVTSIEKELVHKNEVESEIKEFVDYIQNVIYQDQPIKVIDFLSICSSVLLVTEAAVTSLEDKIDVLFSWADMDMDNDITFDELYITITSYEHGLSYVLGHPPASEKYVKAVATQWYSICGFGREIDITGEETLDRIKFFDFCTNRQQPVRRLIEMFAAATVHVDKTGELQEIVAVAKEPSGGDEWMANPAWIKTAQHMTPPNHGENTAKPSSTLELDWVHGYRGFDCRNNLRYASADGSAVVFNAAALGVIQTLRGTQRFFNEHTDDVVCLAVAENTETMLYATGELGKSPAIHLWNFDHTYSLACMRGTHTKAVSQMVFSRDGNTLFSVGIDYTIAMYCTQQGNAQFGKQIASAQGPDKPKVYHAALYQEHFVTCGEKHVIFWKYQKNKLISIEASLSGGFKNLIFLSAANVSDGGAIVGSSNGTLVLFRDEKIACSTTLKDNSINALWSPVSGEYFLVGGKDGSVSKWQERRGSKGELECLGSFNANWAPIRSVCMAPVGSKILVGTQACEIIELEIGAWNKKSTPITDKQTLNSGHFKDELWGLAINPSPAHVGEYCTVGDDGYLRLWSVQQHKQIVSFDMGTMSRCCAYSPDGVMIAAGFGGRVGRGRQKKDGMFRVYRPTREGGNISFTLMHEGREARQWISEIKFSTDGRLLAVGSHDNCIYVYNVAQQFKLMTKFSKHNSYITHFDFSTDSTYLQSNCGAYELLFCQPSSGKQIMKSATLSNTEWATWTCTLGWPVQGIWPPGADGTDINAVDRSPSEKLIASADDFGKVKVFRYPSVTPKKSQFIEYAGHSSHVTNCRWLPLSRKSDDFLITVGGNDKCVFQWRNVQGGDDSGPRRAPAPVTEDDIHIELDAPSGGDEFMAVKPWKGAIVTPTSFESPDESRAVQYFAALGELSNAHQQLQDHPSVAVYDQVARCCDAVNDRLHDSGYLGAGVPDSDELELEWVYGYRGFDARNNLRYVTVDNSSAEVRLAVYFTANLGIVLDGANRKQKYFKGHTDDITCLATTVLNNEVLVATGQLGKANTFVWSATTMALKATLQTQQKSVMLIDFTKDARLLVTMCGNVSNPTVAVTDWSSQRLIAKVDVGERGTPHHLCSGVDMDNLFLTCGDKYMRVWKMAGKNMTSTKITTGKNGTPQDFLCTVFFNNNWVVGCADGSLYVIKNGSNKVGTVLKQHTGSGKGPAVTSIYAANGIMLSGAKDGTAKIWDENFRSTHSFDLKAVASRFNIIGSQIQSLCFVGTDVNNLMILVGTRGCDIIEIECNNGAFAVDEASPLVRGHCNDELWGLATHPSEPICCTTGDDKTLRLWNLHSRQMIAHIPLGIMARCCAYSPDGSLLAVGFGGRVGRGKQKQDGLVRIYSSGNLTQLCEVHDAKQWISDVKFSPDGSILAVGSHNNSIYFYKVENGTDKKGQPTLALKLKSKFSKHNSYITHFDFSVDGRFLQSNCGAYELLFCDTSSGKQITSATELRDVRWASWTCTLGWPVQGIWPAGADGTDINAVDRSHSGHLVATSDDFGKVRVLRYPCIKESAEGLVCAGHSSHVMNVRWTVGDEFLISVGGNDKSIFQWRHTMSLLDSGPAPARRDVVEEDDIVVDLGEPEGGDEFMAVKPWLGAIRAPSNPPPVNPAPPSAELHLHWVHGYTSATVGATNARVSSNLFYNVNKQPVYPAAALGVCFQKDYENHRLSKQTFFTEHTDDIVCLCISADRRFVATGQLPCKTDRGKGTICVWDAADCRLLSKMPQCHQRGVVQLAFSPDGQDLVSVGLDDKFTHTLWRDVGGSWSRVQQVSTQPSGENPILFSRWFRADAGSEYKFVTGGTKSVVFWKVEGSSLSRKECRFGKYKQAPMLCIANLRMKDKFRIVGGTSTGDLYVFEEREVKNSIEKAHSSAVLCLAEADDASFIISGGMDKSVKIWNQALQAISVFQLGQDQNISPVNASVASVDFRIDPDHNIILLLGTYGGEILEVAAMPSEHMTKKMKKSDASDINFDLTSASVTIFQHSHYKGELWGVAPHPKNADLFATCGDDGTIRVWSIALNSMIECLVVDRPARCCAWNAAGNILAVGFHESVYGGGKKKTKGGKKSSSAKSAPAAALSAENAACHIYTFSLESYKLQRIAFGCPSTAWISEVKFSPSGSILAIASHDKSIYFYSVPSAVDNINASEWMNAFKKPKFVFNKHSSAITHIDFSADEKWFQSNCQAYELLFGNLSTGKQETSASKLAEYNAQPTEEIMDTCAYWATWTCTLGWPVQGIWPAGADGTDINAVDRSPSGTMLATSDDFGLVKLFRNPCVTESSKYKSYSGHSSHVTCVRWSITEDLISVGGNDKCVFIWKLQQ